MKKIIVSILMVCMLVSPVYVAAAEQTTIEEETINQGYTGIKEYYQNQHETIQSYYDVYAMYALDIPISKDRAEIQGMLAQDFTSMAAHTLAQNIIAIVMVGEDPRSVGPNSLNLVDLLVSYVRENGVIDKDGNASSAANLQVWCLYALEIVDADYDATACYEYLKSLQEADGGFGFGAGSDADVTAWVLDAFLLNKTYQEDPVINTMVTYISTSELTGGTWGMWGANANTQSSMLQTLITYNKAGILDGTYSNDGNPMASLLSFQNTEGWFGYMDNVEYNWYATYQGAMTLGSYYHEPMYERAKEEYQLLLQNQDSKEEPEDPIVDPNQTVVTEETTETSVVATNDTTNEILYVVYILIAGGFLLIRRGNTVRKEG